MGRCKHGRKYPSGCQHCAAEGALSAVGSACPTCGGTGGWWIRPGGKVIHASRSDPIRLRLPSGSTYKKCKSCGYKSESPPVCENCGDQKKWIPGHYECFICD